MRSPGTLLTAAVLLLASCGALMTPADAQLPVAGTLGTAVQVSANSATTINFATAGAAQLVIELDAAADVTLSAFTDASVSRPSGYNQLAFGLVTGVGFTLAVSGSANIVSAELTTPPLTTAAAATLTGSVEASCLRFDAAAAAYTAIEIDSYTAGTKQVVVTLPVAGSYLFASVDVSANVPLPTLYAEARVTSSSEARTFGYPGGVEVEVTTTTDNTLTVSSSATSSHAVNSGSVAIGNYLTFDLETEETVDAEIRVEYSATAAAAADVAVSTLTLMFWSEANAAWELPATAVTVDAEASVLVQSTTHFSQWGVFGSEGSGGDDSSLADWTGQSLSPASPSNCHTLDDYSHVIGGLKLTVTKTSSGGGNVRMYTRAGSTCPTASNNDYETVAISAQDGTDFICYDSDSTPAVASGDYGISVYAEGLSGATSTTEYSLEVENVLSCPDSAATAAASVALSLVAAVAAALLSGVTQ